MFRGRSIAMCREESFHCKAERKRVGIGYAYRFKLDRAISSSEIAEKLEPLLKGFEAAKAAPAVVKGLAFKLRQLLEEWTG